MEDDCFPLLLLLRRDKFQSTSSVWRTTKATTKAGEISEISIHVLRVEDDPLFCKSPSVIFVFQSTSSVWRTTGRRKNTKCALWSYFNPRPPCGGRRYRCTPCESAYAFQSTSSVWRTTGCALLGGQPIEISIHVLRVEDDGYG